MTQAAVKQTLGFQAEVKQLLSLMVHSLYSNKEIFLRELISNASDAADKLRFEALAHPGLNEDAPELRITLRIDQAARTLTVCDNGIGMSRDEVIANIGTIAKSGTKEFLATLTGDQQKDARLIGQFGVGFYASFIVAERVTLVTRRAGAPAGEGVRWESDGSGEYTLEPLERRARGTEVTLQLRAGEDELLEPGTVKAIVRKYSDHIGLPIVLLGESRVDPVTKEFMPGKEETLNQASALWARPKSEVSDEQYREFYKHVAHDFEDPLAWAHARVEGRHEYTQLLFVPARASFDLWERHGRHGVKLYVKRVFIMEDAEHLMPAYLRFVRGVIDADSLPLNVSREILQQSRDLDAIRGGCVKRMLALLEDLAANQPEKYAAFWSEFGRAFKEGVAEDPANRERIAKLLRLASTHSDQEAQTVSLADYVARMKPGQDRIWYVTAESFGAARSSPHLEVFRRKGVEVLLLGERVDEWLVSALTEFEGKPLASVARGGLDLGELADEAEKQQTESQRREFGDLAARLKAALGERVKDVRVTQRLTDSPACLVADEHDMSANLARILRAAGQKAPAGKPILEINPTHPIVARLKDEAARFDDWAVLLYEQALLAEGAALDDPAGFVRRMNALLLEFSAKG
ncbi:MAG: molecular chaperone HtpG [Betaproteobacteria bacterium RIFCSPLOWO2_02_FULL_68_150]|nr:MAG: molecular chaperone HtpG [Betaproteobacteria bacterium RIFCSPLOWO2_02_FULL_68_150]